MTVTMNDVLGGLKDPAVVRLLGNAVQVVTRRESAEQERASAIRQLQESALRRVRDACKAGIDPSLSRYVTKGYPDGWPAIFTVPTGPDGIFWLEIELPGLEAPLLARFRRNVTSAERPWTFSDYVIPGIAYEHRPGQPRRPILSCAEHARSTCGQDHNVALAGLVQIIADFRARLAEDAQRDAARGALQS